MLFTFSLETDITGQGVLVIKVVDNRYSADQRQAKYQDKHPQEWVNHQPRDREVGLRVEESLFTEDVWQEES